MAGTVQPRLHFWVPCASQHLQAGLRPQDGWRRGGGCPTPRAHLAQTTAFPALADGGGTCSRPGPVDSPRWEGLWGWAECEAGDEAGETEVVPEKLSLKLKLNSSRMTYKTF